MKTKIKNLLFESNKGKIKLNEKASIFFFCLLLSTFFWFLSSLSKVYSTGLSIPITYVSYNNEFILTESPPESIEVIVNGSGFELLGEKLSFNHGSIEVNLKRAQKLNTNRFGIATSSLRNDILNYLDDDLKFERITSDTISFSTEKRVQKKLTVLPVLDLDFKSSFNLMGDVLVEPAEILVSGPKSRMDSLEVLKTGKIKRSGIADSITIDYSFKDEKEYSNLEFEPSEVKLTVPVEKFTEKIFELPVSTENISTEIITFPNKVKVTFLVPLFNYEQFTDNIVEAKVKKGESLTDKKKLRVEIKGVPSFAKLLRVEPEKVEFIIKE